MANRYWVLGTGNWSDTSHWSDTSGGAGGFAVPTSTDDVYFDAASHTTDYTVTIDAVTKTCRNLNFAAPASGNVTWAGSVQMNVSGSLTLYAGLVRTYTGFLLFDGVSAHTITSAGVAFSNQFQFLGTGSWTLQDNFNNPAYTTYVSGGTLDTNGFAFSVALLSVVGAALCVLTLGASTVTASLGVGISHSNLTFNAGTSTITIQGAYNGYALAASGLTFNNVVLQTSIAGHSNNYIIGTGNIFANLTITGGAVKTETAYIDGNHTITGTLTINGQSSINRLLVASVTVGTARTYTAANVSISNADFRDITGAGAASWDLSAITGGSGDCGGNSGITFTTAANQYWVGGTGNWSVVAEWASTSGGAGSSGRVPLPQDTARFDANSFSGASQVVTKDMPRMGSEDWTGATNNPSISYSVAVSYFGSITYISGMLHPASSAHVQTFEGRGSHTITNAGWTWSNKPIVFNAPGGTYTLLDAFTSTSTITMYAGTFDADTFNVTFTSFGSSGSIVRVINMGTGVWTCLATASVAISGYGSNQTFNCETSTIRFTGALTGIMYFFEITGAPSFYNMEVATTGAHDMRWSTHSMSILGTLTVDASAAARAIKIWGGTTITVGGFLRDSGSNVITLSSTVASAATLAKAAGVGAIVLHHCDISYITGSVANVWYASQSTDSGNNTNVTFPAARYWVGGSGNWSDATNHWSDTSGGTPNASFLPTASTDVIFDTNSAGADYTVTIDATTKLCRSLFWAAPSSGNATWAGSVNMDVYGSMILYSGLIRTYTGTITFMSTFVGNAVNTNGTVLAGTITFNGSAGGWTLLGELDNRTGLFYFTTGSFYSGNQIMRCNQAHLEGSGVRSVILGSSDWYFYDTAWFWGNGTTNLTFDAGTSTLRFVGAAYNFLYCPGYTWTFYNAVCNITTFGCYGNITFNNLTVESPAYSCSFGANTTINGTLTINGTSTSSRMNVYGIGDGQGERGSPITLTVNGSVVASYINMWDITAAGSASWDLSAITGGSGDEGGNTGITFTPSMDCYWVADSGTWTDTAKWRTTSGGGVTARIPLPQDDVFFDANSFTTSGRVFTMNGSWGRDVDFSGVTNNPTLSINAVYSMQGSLTLASGMTISGSTGIIFYFRGRGSHTITMAGQTCTMFANFQPVTGTYTLVDAFSFKYMALRSGTLTATANVTTDYFSDNYGGFTPKTRTLNMGSGTWTLTNGHSTPWSIGVPGTITLNCGTSTIRKTGTLTATQTFATGSKTYYNLEIDTTGEYSHNFTGSGTFNDIYIEARNQTQTIKFTAGTTTTVNTFSRDVGVGNDIGANYGGSIGAVQTYYNTITIGSITAASHTLTKAGGGTIILEAMDISYSTANPVRTWHAPNSTNSGNNVRWVFGYPSSGLAGMMLRAGGVLTY